MAARAISELSSAAAVAESSTVTANSRPPVRRTTSASRTAG
ncbi:hypothetical protein NKH77_42080 [Streptomyces sp. M19]